MPIELEWKQTIDIPDGEHKGLITKVTERLEPYHYIDVWIKVDCDSDVEIKYGCPANLSQRSKLGRLLMCFGESFEAGKKIDTETILKNKLVRFMTLKKKNEKGDEYSEIVEDSIKQDLSVPE